MIGEIVCWGPGEEDVRVQMWCLRTGELPMSRTSLLIVEDEAEIAELIAFHAKREGYETRVAQTGREAMALVASQQPDVITLDVLLPDFDGLEVCRRLKGDAGTASIPIVFVSALGEEAEVVAGLELGGDDYVTKPFRPRVLMARVRAVLRRHEEGSPNRLTDPGVVRVGGGGVVIDTGPHEVRVDGVLVELTITEFRLLEHLARRAGFVRTRDQIVSAIRGEGTVLSSRAVDVHVASLRKKLGAAGEIVETVRGVGYRVQAEGEA